MVGWLGRLGGWSLSLQGMTATAADDDDARGLCVLQVLDAEKRRQSTAATNGYCRKRFAGGNGACLWVCRPASLGLVGIAGHLMLAGRWAAGRPRGWSGWYIWWEPEESGTYPPEVHVGSIAGFCWAACRQNPREQDATTWHSMNSPRLNTFLSRCSAGSSCSSTCRSSKNKPLKN